MPAAPTLPQHQLKFIHSCLKSEQEAIRECKLLAQQTQDTEITEICSHMANKHQQHYNIVLQHVQSYTPLIHLEAGTAQFQSSVPAAEICRTVFALQNKLIVQHAMAASAINDNKVRQDLLNILQQQHQALADIKTFIKRRGIGPFQILADPSQTQPLHK